MAEGGESSASSGSQSEDEGEISPSHSHTEGTVSPGPSVSHRKRSTTTSETHLYDKRARAAASTSQASGIDPPDDDAIFLSQATPPPIASTSSAASAPSLGASARSARRRDATPPPAPPPLVLPPAPPVWDEDVAAIFDVQFGHSSRLLPMSPLVTSAMQSALDGSADASTITAVMKEFRLPLLQATAPPVLNRRLEKPLQKASRPATTADREFVKLQKAVYNIVGPLAFILQACEDLRDFQPQYIARAAIGALRCVDSFLAQSTKLRRLSVLHLLFSDIRDAASLADMRGGESLFPGDFLTRIAEERKDSAQLDKAKNLDKPKGPPQQQQQQQNQTAGRGRGQFQQPFNNAPGRGRGRGRGGRQNYSPNDSNQQGGFQQGNNSGGPNDYKGRNS